MPLLMKVRKRGNAENSESKEGPHFLRILKEFENLAEGKKINEIEKAKDTRKDKPFKQPGSKESVKI